ncbi:unnamed protein product [marine sediment metagenome]|uniref:DUF8098 domain-containing protein n=1 Tax=marine sediment metagenome TaxID=412755 RepID=X1LBK9_9ZZZZ
MFSVVVLNSAKVTFGASAKYLGATRMVKLVALVAENTGHDLTRGWYKYGYYAPNAHDVIREFAGKDHYNLSIFEAPKEILDLSYETFRAKIPHIEAYVDKIKDLGFFVTEWGDFLNWVYRDLAPEKYKNFYLTHVEFGNFLGQFEHYLGEPTVWGWQFKEFGPKLENLVTRYHNQIGHVDDGAILGLFYDFMDLLEMIELRIENKEYNVGPKELSFLEDLNKFYNQRVGQLFVDDLWMLLVPYRQTLTGPLAETERQKYSNRVKKAEASLKLSLSNLIQTAKKLDLLPSIVELEVKIKKMDEKFPTRKPLREVYSLF